MNAQPAASRNGARHTLRGPVRSMFHRLVRVVVLVSMAQGDASVSELNSETSEAAALKASIAPKASSAANTSPFEATVDAKLITLLAALLLQHHTAQKIARNEAHQQNELNNWLVQQQTELKGQQTELKGQLAQQQRQVAQQVEGAHEQFSQLQAQNEQLTQQNAQLKEQMQQIQAQLTVVMESPTARELARHRASEQELSKSAALTAAANATDAAHRRATAIALERLPLPQVQAAGHIVGLKAAGVLCTEAKKVGYTLEEAVAAGFAEELKAGGYTADEAKAVGFVKGLQAAGFSAAEAKSAGFSMPEIRAGGIVTGLRGAGYKIQEAIDAGYSLTEIRLGGYPCKELFELGSTVMQVKKAGYSCEEVNAAGYSLQEVKAAG